MVYALAYYWCARKFSIIPYVLTFLTLIYAVWYILLIDKTSFVIEQANVCRFCYYYLCMMAGLIIKKREQRPSENTDKNNRRKICYAVLAAGTFVGSYGFKLVINHYIAFMWLQFLCQVLNLVCVVCIFWFFQSNENKINGFKCNGIISKISSYSWEIYLTQTLIIPLCVALSFPTNLLVVLLMIAIASYLLKSACKVIIR